MKHLKPLEKTPQFKKSELKLIVPKFKLSTNILLKYFSSSSKKIKFKNIKCEFCNNEYPDDIQQRLQTFKFRVSVCCPICGAYLDVVDF